MKNYKINRSGLRKMMTSDPQLHRALFTAANKIHAVARSLAPVGKAPGDPHPGRLRASGRVEDLGVKPVWSGEPRMTVAVTFYAPYAVAMEKKYGFLSGAIGKGPKT
jgi:hypothetical protein